MDYHESYEVLGGVIRNLGDGWFFIEDDVHQMIGIKEITQDNEKVIIKYSEKNKVISTTVTVDETMAAEGYTVGASVGKGETWIFIYDKYNNLINPSEYKNAMGNIWIHGIFKR
ncbi:hypothetical protein [Peribacillus frigoritolerans]|uniref:hypothetical protein n=1 Tax=Peribacillus frigoritolerans TaxID=450367 RepID=UPI001E32CB91|nr:hypothetical protein [Peribacillus frigoritolerans]